MCACACTHVWVMHVCTYVCAHNCVRVWTWLVVAVLVTFLCLTKPSKYDIEKSIWSVVRILVVFVLTSDTG